MQTGEFCRLPKTPKSRSGVCLQSQLLIPAPRSVAKHYFDEQINTPSEFAEDGSMYSAYSVGSQWDPEPDEL